MISRSSKSCLRLFFGSIVVGAVVFLSVARTAYSEEFCDPGAHFIDGCLSGVNYVEGRLDIGIDTSLDGVADFDGVFIGYVRLVRSDPLDDSLNFPGTRPVDGHLGVIDLVMPSMRSTGLSGTATEGWTIRTGTNSGVNQPTYGRAAECESGAQDCVDNFEDPFWAHSVFHLFFELDIPGMGTLHNHNPNLPNDNAFLIGTEISTAPPLLGTQFIPVNAVTGFFDANGQLAANVTAILASSESASSSHAKNLNGNLSQNGAEGDGQTSVVYIAATGELRIDVPAGFAINSINIDSAGGIFTGQPAQNLESNSDNNDTDSNIIKSTSQGSFGSTSFGNVAQAGLSESFLLNDLSVVGSLAGGAGAFGDLDLVYLTASQPIPTVSEWALIGMALLLLTAGAVVFGRRRRTATA